MESTVVLRSRTSQALGAALVAVSVVTLGATALDGLEALLRYAAPVALLGLLGWAAFWRPHVEVSDGGITVVNTLRTLELAWPAVEGVDGRYGLQLRTASGTVTAWSAGAPAGRHRAREQHSRASAVVAERLAALRAAGHLDDPRLEHPSPRVVWHREVVVAVLVLGAASVLLPLLA